MKIAIIGCGYWGKNLVRNFASLGALEYVCDANQAVADKMAADYKVKSLPIDQVMESDVDGVVIAAPAVLHASLTEKALNAGKHVFVEKPLSLEVAEAEKLCALAKAKNLHLMVGHLLQYHPAFLELKRMIGKGDLGKLQYIYSNRLNLGKIRNEENILWSFAPHDISMILSLAGDLPSSVYATGACHLNPRIQDVTTTHMNFDSGIQAHVFVSWLHPFKEQKLVVVGDRGMAVFDDRLDWGEKLSVYPHQVNWVDGMPIPDKADAKAVPLDVSEPLKLECQHFIECIQENKTPRTDGQEGLRVLQVLDAAQQALHTGASVALTPLTKNYYAHETACVDNGVKIGQGTKIWHYSHLIKGTEIGQNCVIGQNVMIGPDVVVGDACKIQNNVSLYKGVTLGKGVFCGPSAVFTNVNTPRAEVERKDEFLPTDVQDGVTIGANATIICGNSLGAYSLIGAGAVITKEVKPHALMVGNPAKQIGWVSHAGEKLGDDFICPREGRKYALKDNMLIEIKKNDTSSKAA